MGLTELRSRVSRAVLSWKLRENLFPHLFQLLEAAQLPRLVAPPPSKPAMAGLSHATLAGTLPPVLF